jgi:hypothetical protein
MNGFARRILRIYCALLSFYPVTFRDEFGDEMIAVFAQALMDAAERGRWAVMVVYLREVREMPINMVREYRDSIIKKEFTVNEIQKPEWSFYPTWILLTTFCIPFAFFFDLFILKVITSIVGDYIYVDGVRHITEDYLCMYAAIPIVGLLTGYLQYRLLHRYLPRMGWWVLATTGGWLLGALLIMISGWLNFWTTESFDLGLAFIVIGLTIGVGQWLLLRRCLPRAGWWVVANVLGWGLLGLIIGDSFGNFGLMLMGFLPACVTAVMLALLMNQAHPTDPQGA